jgi:integrase
MTRTTLRSLITGMTLATAALDWATLAELSVPVLFAFPLALCAGRRSKKMLWSTAAVAVAQSVGAGVWGFHRSSSLTRWGLAVDRGLVIDSLLGLTVLFHMWINKSQAALLEAAKAERHRFSLIERNEHLETALAKVKTAKQGKRKPLILTIRQYQTLAEHLSDLHRTMLVTVMCSGISIAKVLDLRWEQVDLENNLIFPQPVTADRESSKTQESAGAVALDPVLREALTDWRNKSHNIGLIFSSTNDRPQQPQAIEKEYLRPAARMCGLSAISWNLFPRSYTAWIAQEGTATVHRKLLRSTISSKAPLKIKETPKAKMAPRPVTAADFPAGISAGAS